MKQILFLILLVILQTSLFAAEKGEEVKFKSFTSPYFERNDSNLKGKSTYLVIPDSRTFQSIFGIGRTMGKAPATVPDNAFENGLVLAVIKRGEGITHYKVEGVKVVEDNLIVSYQAAMDPPGTATFHSPIIFTVEKGKYKNVIFRENDKTVEKVSLKDLGK